MVSHGPNEVGLGKTADSLLKPRQPRWRNAPESAILTLLHAMSGHRRIRLLSPVRLFRPGYRRSVRHPRFNQINGAELNPMAPLIQW